MDLSLYIHIPFCKSKCFYCSFPSFERKDELIDSYLEVLKKEAANHRGVAVNTVYIGGGTPTYLSMTQLEHLFDTLHENFVIAKNAEVTIEANPATFDFDKALGLFQMGVNRVSLGVQSLNDNFLKYLGRPHSHFEALSAFGALRQVAFKNISCDLIYSLPGQTDKEIEEDVLGLVALGGEHISLYALTISEGSEFYKRRVESHLQESQSQHFFLVKTLLEKNGFHHYEVSNFAKPGYECKHNLNYWRGGNYIGLGSSSHSHIDGHRFWNVEGVEEYISMLRRGISAKVGEERLRGVKRLMESFLIGLRLTEGVDVKGLEARYGIGFPAEKQEEIADLIRHGLLTEEAGRIRATPAGMVVLDEMCGRLI